MCLAKSYEYGSCNRLHHHSSLWDRHKNQAHLRQKSSFARFLCKCTKILFKAKNRKSFFSFLSLFFDKAFTQRLDILDAKMKCDDKQPLIPIVKCMRQEYKRNKKEITKADAFFLSS